MIRIFTSIMLIASLASCSSVARNITGAESTPSISILPATGQTVVHEDVILQGEATETVTFGIFKTGPNTRAVLSGSVDSFKTSGANKLKEAALYEALKDSPYDIVINPKYIVTTNKSLFTSKTNVKVIGYAGSITFD